MSDRAGQAGGTGDRPRVSRELSMLAFNARVLHEATDPRNKILDRFTFLGIVAANLDEFFAVRVAAIREQRDAGVRAPGLDGLLAGDLLDEIRRGAAMLAGAQQATWRELLRDLAAAGHRLVRWEELDDASRGRLRGHFVESIQPVLTPLSVDAGHPFPFISGGSLSIAFSLRDASTGAERFARVKVPPIIDRLVAAGEGVSILLEDLIKANATKVFTGYEIVAAHCFRVTRDADIEVQEGEADDLLLAIEEELRQRRFGRVVRLELERNTPTSLRATLVEELEIGDDAVQEIDGVLDLRVATEVARLPYPELHRAPWTPVTPARIARASQAASGGADLFAVIREGDLLLHHPYESFDASVERLFSQAAEDPDVLSIRATLYRTGARSSIAESLVRAARSGKEVVVLVELKARFDEAANIQWAKRLESAGAHVIYGMMGLKTHCKATLIARREEGQIRRYVHLSTGNYNPATARLYTDVGLMTCDPDFSADVGNLFDYLTGAVRHPSYSVLLVAPHDLRRGISERIRRATEAAAAGATASIFIKVNALVDAEMIGLLDAAAASGVAVELAVRGMCGLIPDPVRHGDRLRIRSIVGEFLEHSRLFRFTDRGGTAWFAGSADLMERNLDRRVEVLFPLRSGDAVARAAQIEASLLADTRNAWRLEPDGSWAQEDPSRTEAISSFTLAKEAAAADADGRG